MSHEFEFRSQSLSQKATIYGVRGALIALIASAIYFLVTAGPKDLDMQLRHAGGIFVLIWAYANVVQAKYEIQELFVPPFNLDQASESLIIGIILTTASLFFGWY